MTFLELYGDELDVALGTEDRTERFTTARRQTAINEAQREFARKTDCFVREAQVDLSEGIAEYDLESVINDEAFLRFAAQQPYLELTDADGNVTRIEGDSFKRKDIPILDREEPGWRGASDGTPSAWYFRESGGSLFIGLSPAPEVPAGESWLLFVPFVSYPADMVSDTDEPFAATTGGNPVKTLRAYHPALVKYAAARLEQLRRNYQIARMRMQEFEELVQDYMNRRRPTGGRRVVLAHNYMSAAMSRSPEASDPRR